MTQQCTWCIRKENTIEVTISILADIKTRVKIQFKLFFKLISNFWVFMLRYFLKYFHSCSIYYCWADIDEARVVSILEIIKSKNSISTFFRKKIKFLGYHAVVILKTFQFTQHLLL